MEGTVMNWNESILSRIPKSGNLEEMSIDDHIQNMKCMRVSCAEPVADWDKVEKSNTLLNLSLHFRDTYGVKTLGDFSEMLELTGYPTTAVRSIYGFSS